MKSINFYIAFIILFNSCSNSNQNDFFVKNMLNNENVNSYSYPNYLKSLLVKGELIDLPNELSGVRKIFFDDGDLYFAFRNKEYCLASFSKKDQKLEFRIVRGDGPNELLGVTNLKKHNDSFFVFDIVTRKILNIKDGEVIDEMKTPETFLNIFPTRIGFIGQSLQREFPLTVLDSNLEIQKNLGSFRKLDKVDIPYIIAQAFQGPMDYNYKKNTMVLGGRYTDKLNIFNLDKQGEQLEISGPLNYEPIFSITEQNETAIFTQNDQGRFSYIDVIAEDQYIIGLFSGKSREEAPGRANFGDKILIFDYAGKLLYNIELDRRLISIAFDNQNKIMYGLDILSEEDEKVYSYDFSFVEYKFES